MLLQKLLIPIGGLILLTGCFSSNNNEASNNNDTNDNNNDNNEATEEVRDVQETDVSIDLTIGEITTVSGFGGMGLVDAESEETQMHHPAGLIPFDDGFLVADSGNHVIRYISMSGQSETFAGGYDGYDDFDNPEGGMVDDTGEDARFHSPMGLAYDEDEDLIYVADAGNGAIRTITSGGDVETLTEDLLFPADVVLLGGELIVSEARGHRLQVVDPTSGEATFLAGGDYDKEDGQLIGRFADGSGEDAGFNEPFGLAVHEDVIIVADSGNQRIRQVDLSGNVDTIAGTGENLIPGADYIAGGSEDGPVSEASFNFPRDVAVLDNGGILVADTYNHRIRLIANDEVMPVAGHEVHGKVDGAVEDALFDGPFGILLFGERIIIADHWNHMIREIELTN